MERKAGIALVIFAFLLVITMVLHPAGGSIQHINRISALIITTHAIAIFSLPFGWIGFYGLTQRMGSGHFLSGLAFFFISMGMIAILLAAATNGLILPLFLQHYNDASAETLRSIKPISHYGFAINQAFDYIYTFAFCIAIALWSVSIYSSRKLPLWLCWLGLLICLIILALFIYGTRFNELSGFRLSVSIIIVWVVLAGAALIRSTKSDLH